MKVELAGKPIGQLITATPQLPSRAPSAPCPRLAPQLANAAPGWREGSNGTGEAVRGRAAGQCNRYVCIRGRYLTSRASKKEDPSTNENYEATTCQSHNAPHKNRPSKRQTLQCTADPHISTHLARPIPIMVTWCWPLVITSVVRHIWARRHPPTVRLLRARALSSDLRRHRSIIAIVASLLVWRRHSWRRAACPSQLVTSKRSVRPGRSTSSVIPGLFKPNLVISTCREASTCLLVLYLLHRYRLAVPFASAMIDCARYRATIWIVIATSSSGVVTVRLVGVKVRERRDCVGVVRSKVGCGVVVGVHERACRLGLTIESSRTPSGVCGYSNTSVCPAVRVEIWPFDGFICVPQLNE